ncbi:MULTISPECIES: sulfotransferase family protein [unclassified Mesorhizobium]|uniref:sulfotransferase family protein n=1 Tax=unclassified Mesorhizobium TaxID=325217 RepID=UPI000FC9CEA1|nr:MULTISPECIES: hypothetical protein [unclassified Mesorhizobium]RUW34137.1 hypothetical protein EOA38_11275 [Mesorhizobium sp. M1E.F.Ca.ET.041.01.1.1]RWD79525.1 MAG: hypothetical protein EOS38_31620 [Mesorhizobium sp.]RWD86817.1 MAG: hypothetical protein EOS39_26535 [Mesorhizobium sp.]TIV49516.1 MAG: hypothetical protein E5V88_24325 [Mesorhizobium sp.]
MATKATAVCILGMHRSGTSSVTRAISLLGFYLGGEANLMGPGADNPEGFWEHREICALQERLLEQLNRRWDTPLPLPEGWHQTEMVRPFREELKQLIASNFAGHTSWAWKDPRSCLLMPLWRDILAELHVDLRCLFVVRSPIEVTNSLARRDPISVDHAMGAWFNYCITALKDTIDVPTAFLSYDGFMASWETELRRCADILDLDWLDDEKTLHETMRAFIRPDLRHNRSTWADLTDVPPPARKLYETLVAACAQTASQGDCFKREVSDLAADFHAYARFFESDLQGQALPSPINRTFSRWRKSFRKRFSH